MLIEDEALGLKQPSSEHTLSALDDETIPIVSDVDEGASDEDATGDSDFEASAEEIAHQLALDLQKLHIKHVQDPVDGSEDAEDAAEMPTQGKAGKRQKSRQAIVELEQSDQEDYLALGMTKKGKKAKAKAKQKASRSGKETPVSLEAEVEDQELAPGLITLEVDASMPVTKKSRRAKKQPGGSLPLASETVTEKPTEGQVESETKEMSKKDKRRAKEAAKTNDGVDDEFVSCTSHTLALRCRAYQDF